MAVRIVPIGGLGNRIRSILSYRSAYGPIEVLWTRAPAVCGGRWEDAFLPLEGVTFTDAGTGHAHDYVGDATVTYEQVSHEAKDGWTKGYAELRAAPYVMERVQGLAIRMGGPTAAIHARRGDHTAHSALFGHHTTNEELRIWALEQAGTIYLATDCPETQLWFRNNTGGLFIEHAVAATASGYEQRPGRLADAAVDLFRCASATTFKGSWMSSFSETIELIRCGGEVTGPMRHWMPSADAEWYRGRPDRARERLGL